MNINEIARKLKPYLPEKIVEILNLIYFRLYMTVLVKYCEIKEKKNHNKLTLPPASLRYRVCASLDVQDFLNEGEKCRTDILTALNSVGMGMHKFRCVLDFGCGCGRTIRWFTGFSDKTHFHGTDIDNNAIEYCRKYLSDMEFKKNDFLPPLDYPENFFDLIYSISVFTHIDEYHQFTWLQELYRVACPGAIILLSVHGEHCWSSLPLKHKSEIMEKGIAFVSNDIWKGIFPSGYQTTYHSKNYIFENYSKYFRILEYVPQGISNFQDLVILQKSTSVLPGATERE